jgi:hypothetical protein
MQGQEHEVQIMPSHESSDTEIIQAIERMEGVAGKPTPYQPGDFTSGELMNAIVDVVKAKGKGKINGVIGVTEWSDTL